MQTQATPNGLSLGWLWVCMNRNGGWETLVMGLSPFRYVGMNRRLRGGNDMAKAYPFKA